MCLGSYGLLDISVTVKGMTLERYVSVVSGHFFEREQKGIIIKIEQVNVDLYNPVVLL